MPPLAIAMKKKMYIHKQNLETKNQIFKIYCDIAKSNFMITSH